MFPIKQEPVIKQEPMEPGEILINENLLEPVLAIDQRSSDFDFHNLDSSTLDYDSRVSSDFNGVESSHKKQKLDNNLGIVLPIRSFNPVPQSQSSVVVQSCKQFWKAGDYEGGLIRDSSSSSSFGSMDHVRVHPKFLHSNATSHKWALGAFAELLDNSLDEVCYGATFVHIDVLKNNKDGNKMLLVEDNGGGMDPQKMRKCMSLGYSAKSKLANTIGQYGNGFKTSTMRLGADVIVFSQCRGKDGKSPTRSIGMLSYTFLRNTGKEDIVVPILDYEKGQDWNKIMRSSPEDLNSNIEVILQWSPYSSEADLLDQFNLINDQGTRVIIYNLWEDEQGELELDFDTDQYDIQIKGVNRDVKKIEMAEQFPNSRHYLTHQHSLRSYASILYLRLPDGFRIVLRGKDVEHHDIVNDMMLTEAVTYRPKPGGGGSVPNMVAVVTIGFVKDAKSHIDVQGFNVYHKNRLIKPFWRIWNAAGSNGRGIIGVLEANFVEPAHDKQGFERTTVLSRLEARLLQLQKRYWTANCHRIGYVSRHGEKLANGSAARERSPDCPPPLSSCHLNINHGNGHLYSKVESGKKSTTNSGNQSSYLEPTSISAENVSNYETPTVPPDRFVNVSSHMAAPPPIQKYFMKDNSHTTQSFSPNMSNGETEPDRASNGRFDRVLTPSQSKAADITCSGNATFGPNSNALSIVQVKVENHELEDRSNNMESSSFLPDLQLEIDRCRSLEDQVNGHSLLSLDPLSLYQLKVENQELKDRLKKMEESSSRDLKIEKDKYKLLEAHARYLISNLEIKKRIVCDQLKESERKIEEISNDQQARIIIFHEERNRRDNELMAASKTIQELLQKVAQLENMKSPTCKQER